MGARIRKGDTVEVTVGKYAGVRGRVLSVDAQAKRVTVERVNMVKRHTRPTAQYRQGGIIEKERSIDVSNVALVHKGERTRVGFREVAGTKLRWSIKHDEAIDG